MLERVELDSDDIKACLYRYTNRIKVVDTDWYEDYCTFYSSWYSDRNGLLIVDSLDKLNKELMEIKVDDKVYYLKNIEVISIECKDKYEIEFKIEE